MVDYKAALVIIAVIVVCSQTAYCDCYNTCYNVANYCLESCSDQACANVCTKTLIDCYDACDNKGKREFDNSFLRDEPYQDYQASDEDGFSDKEPKKALNHSMKKVTKNFFNF